MDTTSAKPTVKEFVVMVWQDWGSRVSGVLSVPFTVLALLAKSDYARGIWGVLAFVALFLTIYQVWARERKKRREAEEKLVPTLKLYNLKRREFSDSTLKNQTEYHFFVFNSSAGKSITVEVQLRNMEPVGIQYLPVHLHIKHDNALPHQKEFILNPGTEKAVDLVMGPVSHLSSGPMRILDIVAPQGTVIPSGKYRLGVLASGSDVSPVPASFEIWIDENGSLQCRQLD